MRPASITCGQCKKSWHILATLNREIDRLEWFEQHFQPGEPCRFCGCFKHTDDCAFVTHTQEGAEDER